MIENLVIKIINPKWEIGPSQICQLSEWETVTNVPSAYRDSLHSDSSIIQERLTVVHKPTGISIEKVSDDLFLASVPISKLAYGTETIIACQRELDTAVSKMVTIVEEIVKPCPPFEWEFIHSIHMEWTFAVDLESFRDTRLSETNSSINQVCIRYFEEHKNHLKWWTDCYSIRMDRGKSLNTRKSDEKPWVVVSIDFFVTDQAFWEVTKIDVAYDEIDLAYFNWIFWAALKLLRYSGLPSNPRLSDILMLAERQGVKSAGVDFFSDWARDKPKMIVDQMKRALDRRKQQQRDREFILKLPEDHLPPILKIPGLQETPHRTSWLAYL